MIPLRDNIRSRRVPFVNYLLIALNVLAFMLELGMGAGLEAFIRAWAVVPAELRAAPASELVTVVTSMFLHGGIAHILGNMLYLYIFGDNVEDRMGHAAYLVFYLAMGSAAAVGHVLSAPGSTVPTIGASGAVAGVMGAYMVLYPRARVLTILPLFIFIEVVELPAVAYLFLWFVVQFFQGALAITSSPAAGGVAWWAHIAGFIAGGLTVFVFGLRRRRRAYQPVIERPWSH